MNNDRQHSLMRNIRGSRVCVFLLMILTATAVSGCAHKNSLPSRLQRENQTLQAYPHPQLETAITSLGPAQGLSYDMNVFVNTDIYFDFDSCAVTAGAIEILQEKTAFLNNHPEVKLLIEGHCDERGTTEYNLALGEKRAESARRYLESQGIEIGRMEIISYGKEKPLDTSHDEKAWSKNRRAHFNIIKQ